MIRMEIAMFLVLSFIAFIYLPAERKQTQLHRTFSVLLVCMLIHLVFDTITVYTVRNLDTVPVLLNDILHRFFIGTMVLVMHLFYRYISILVEEETGRHFRFDLLAKAFLVLAEIGVMILPVHYAVTPSGNYSDGIHANVAYAAVAVYLILCVVLLLGNWKRIPVKKKQTIAAALLIEITSCVIQSRHPTWLLSGMGLTLMTLAFYLTLENPEILRAELVEQKMSMLYLKSQVNPHFLYNTLDTIRIQAQLNGDKKVADLLMRLVEFFRISVKVNRSMVEVDDELDLVDAYMDLMCYRYPELQYEIDADPELGDEKVPNFILQPIIENSLLHGLRNRGYRGRVKVTIQKTDDHSFEIAVEDSGSGFEEGKKAAVDEMLRNYAKAAPKLEGNSIGILNVQKRIKLLCGREYGISYTENPAGGVTAHIRLPLSREGQA